MRMYRTRWLSILTFAAVVAMRMSDANSGKLYFFIEDSNHNVFLLGAKQIMDMKDIDILLQCSVV